MILEENVTITFTKKEMDLLLNIITYPPCENVKYENPFCCKPCVDKEKDEIKNFRDVLYSKIRFL